MMLRMLNNIYTLKYTILSTEYNDFLLGKKGYQVLEVLPDDKYYQVIDIEIYQTPEDVNTYTIALTYKINLQSNK